MSEQVKAALVIAVSIIAATVGCGGSSSSAPTSPTVTTAPAIPKANLVAIERPLNWYRIGFGSIYRLDGLGQNLGPGCANNVTWTTDYFGESGGLSDVLLNTKSTDANGYAQRFEATRIIPPNVTFEYTNTGRSGSNLVDKGNRYATTFEWDDVVCP